MMDKDRLRAHLEQLHAELQQVGKVADNDRELLQTLERDVREILGRAEVDPEARSGLGNSLRGALAQLEASHPRITILLRDVIDELAYMGI
jgi:hypothetical protein